MAADCMSLTRFRKKGLFRWLFLLVDSFSLYLMIRPIKSASGRAVHAAFLSCLEEYPFKMHNIITDHGVEMIAGLKKECEKRGIDFILANRHSPNKSCVAERMVRTLRTHMARILTENKNLSAVEAAELATEIINKTPTSITKIAPANVEMSNAYTVLRNRTEHQHEQDSKLSGLGVPRFQVGDQVYLSKSLRNVSYSKIGDAKYDPYFFIISEIINTSPRLSYRIRKENSTRSLEGSFAESDLQRRYPNV